MQGEGIEQMSSAFLRCLPQKGQTMKNLKAGDTIVRNVGGKLYFGTVVAARPGSKFVQIAARLGGVIIAVPRSAVRLASQIG